MSNRLILPADATQRVVKGEDPAYIARETLTPARKVGGRRPPRQKDIAQPTAFSECAPQDPQYFVFKKRITESGTSYLFVTAKRTPHAAWYRASRLAQHNIMSEGEKLPVVVVEAYTYSAALEAVQNVDKHLDIAKLR